MVLPLVLFLGHTLTTLYQDYLMENWPVSPSCNDALESSKRAHHLNPIPTYDVQGKLIRPTEYEILLLGARSVLLHRTLPAQKVK